MSDEFGRAQDKDRGIDCNQIRSSGHDIVAISGQWVDIIGFWLANHEFGYGG